MDNAKDNIVPDEALAPQLYSQFINTWTGRPEGKDFWWLVLFKIYV